jgi:hypothetical protein
MWSLGFSRKLAMIADKGFRGSGYITPFKKPKGGELTWLQNDFNNQLSGLRAADRPVLFSGT